jgi:hypothetical protein
MELFSSASDLHGDRRDPVAVKLFKTFVEDFKPKHRIFKGDLWDFRALRVGASKEEKMHSMKLDFEAGMEFLEWYKPTVITLGNHDQRLWDIVSKDGLKKTGPLADYAQDLIEEFLGLAGKLKTIIRPYDKRKGVWSYSGLSFVHGFDGNDAATMARTYGNVLFGHGHRIEMASAPDLRHPAMGRMTGSLALKDLTYNRAQLKTLEQEHGWAYGGFFGRNRHEVFQARVNNQTVVYADHLKTISA